MQTWLRRLLWLNRVRPVTYLDVEPATLEGTSEEQIREARGKLVGAIIDMERASYQVKRELTDNVLRIVARDYQ